MGSGLASGLSAGSMLIGLLGDQSESAAKQKEAKDNQQLANEAAADALQRGGKEAGQIRLQGSQLIGEQKVAYAASGVDPTEGTPANVAADTRALSDLDARTAENNAAREAWGFRTHGMQYGQQAQLEATRSSFRSTGTILGGLGKAASWYAKGMDDLTGGKGS